MTDAPAFDPVATRHSWDALTPAEMHRRGSLKWTQSPFPSLPFWPENPQADADPSSQPIGAWVAEMDLGTAPAVAQVLHRAVDEGTLGYMPSEMAQAARAAATAYVAEEFGWQVPLAEVSLLPNVLSALSGVIAHHTRPGSAVIVPTPAYMPFLSIPGQEGRECIQVPSLCEFDAAGAPHWRLDLDGIEAAMADGAGLLILCNPWNPVGRVLTAEELDAVAALSARYGVVVFSDEIHSPLIVDPAATFIPYASRPGADLALTFTATAASKGWNIPGLHCAFLIASGEARRAWDTNGRTASLAHMAAPLGAAAATAAFTGGREWNAEVRRYVAGNARHLRERLGQISDGVARRLTVPSGSYLAWLDLDGVATPEGLSPAQWLARDCGLHFNPGGAFGRGYENFARVNLAAGRTVVDLMATRLTQALTLAGISE